MKISDLSINTLKINGVAAVNRANSGHPGIVLSAATMIYTLFVKHMNFSVENPKWINRDRFILSAGHGSALLYAQLRLLGLISKEDLMNFRQENSLTPGHPEYLHTKGVESTTGPLGQGIAIAVGIAVAQAHLESKFKEIDHYTYVLCGDGDLQEGVTNESLSFAGRQQLSKLIILYDSNDIQLDTPVNKTFNENVKMKMEALNFHYVLVTNNNVTSIHLAIKNAKKSNKPVFIEIKTIIGDGAPGEGTTKVHGAPIGDGINILKKHLNWEYDNFEAPKVVKAHYKSTIIKRGMKNLINSKKAKNLKNT